MWICENQPSGNTIHLRADRVVAVRSAPDGGSSVYLVGLDDALMIDEDAATLAERIAEAINALAAGRRSDA